MTFLLGTLFGLLFAYVLRKEWRLREVRPKDGWIITCPRCTQHIALLDVAKPIAGEEWFIFAEDKLKLTLTKKQMEGDMPCTLIREDYK